MPWRERSKSLILTCLVIASFVLTSMLWNYQPQFELISPATYVSTDRIGQTKQLEETIIPEAIIFHYGNDRHTKASAYDGQFGIVKNELSKWFFYDFLILSLSPEKWDEIAHHKQGLEIQYRASVPVSIISQLVTFRGEMSEQVKSIDRIWMYHEEADNSIYALFISTKERKVVRARTAVEYKDLRDSYLSLGKYLPEQILKEYTVTKANARANYLSNFLYIYYLPKELVKVRQFYYNYIPITEKQLTATYFLDPTLVRQVVERDGTVIFTDANRSLQMRPGQQAFTFTYPAIQERGESLTDEDKLREATTFINQHLGWTDDYRLENFEERGNDEAHMSFRQYIGAYPLHSVDSQAIDSIHITLEKGQIETVKRSMTDFDTYLQYKDWTLPSGHDLFQLLRTRQIDTSQISNAYVAYLAEVKSGYIELMPSWVIERQGTREVLTAEELNRPEGGRNNGLE